jgi:hypothetical protein
LSAEEKQGAESRRRKAANALSSGNPLLFTISRVLFTEAREKWISGGFPETDADHIVLGAMQYAYKSL